MIEFFLGLGFLVFLGFLGWLLYKDHRRIAALQAEQSRYYREGAVYFRSKTYGGND